jgi:hypothetical protein
MLVLPAVRATPTDPSENARYLPVSGGRADSPWDNVGALVSF